MSRSIRGFYFTAAMAIAAFGAGCGRSHRGGLPVPSEPLGVLRGDQTSNLDPAAANDAVAPQARHETGHDRRREPRGAVF